MGKPLVLCSELHGTLVDAAGQPVAGVLVVRTWEWAWKGKKGRDEATTDAAGRFAFPEVTGSSWSVGLIPHTASILQTVTAYGADGPVELLVVDKASYERDAELSDTGLTGPGIRVRCRIDKEPSADGPFWGTCEAP